MDAMLGEGVMGKRAEGGKESRMYAGSCVEIPESRVQNQPVPILCEVGANAAPVDNTNKRRKGCAPATSRKPPERDEALLLLVLYASCSVPVGAQKAVEWQRFWMCEQGRMTSHTPHHTTPHASFGSVNVASKRNAGGLCLKPLSDRDNSTDRNTE